MLRRGPSVCVPLWSGRRGPALGSFLIAVTETDEKQLEQRRAFL